MLDFNPIKSNELILNPEFRTQEDINQAYDALAESCSIELNATYINKPPKVASKLSRSAINNFFNANISTDRLQSKNILLRSDLFQKVTLAPKHIIDLGTYQRSFDTNNRVYNFSFLSKGEIEENSKIKTVYFLTTIQFKLPKRKSLIAESIGRKTAKNFEKLFTDASPNSVEEVAFLADKADDFSIHYFYLPHGIKSSKIDDAVLLMRYDHTSDPHRNGCLPLLYQGVYPSMASEPHFHFTASFGNIYKLTPKNEDFTFGVGYAIGITQLKQYLSQLIAGSNHIINNNDMGMPFLHILNNPNPNSDNIEEIYKSIKKLDKYIKSKRKSDELALVLNVILGSTFTLNTNLTNEKQL